MGPILVTGANGTMGRELVRLLRAGGQPVRAAIHAASSGQVIPDEGLHAVTFDFGRPETYATALRDVRALFLLRPPAIADTKAYIDPFITAAARAGVGHVVFLSLLGAERIPVVPHYRIEQSLLAPGMSYTFLRPSFFMQNLSGTHRGEVHRGLIAVPAGRGRTSFVDARDVAAVAARALTEEGHAGRAYPLTGAVALDYDEVAAVLSAVLGRPVLYTNPSLASFVRRQLARRQPVGMTLVMAAIYTTARLGLAATVTPDLANLLGRPPTSLRQFALDYQDCWQ